VNARILRPKHGPRILARPLRNGDVDTVLAVFHRLNDRSRRHRFNGAKARLSEDELWQLALVDANHYTLVARVDGDPEPVALARLVRDGDSAEIAFEVATVYQRQGIGSILTAELLADARAVGIREITALVANDNRAALALLRRTLDKIEITIDGRELWIRATLSRPTVRIASSW
jgi:ribosomal protein S18 acetylase RimI-like enzyme